MRKTFGRVFIGACISLLTMMWIYALFFASKESVNQIEDKPDGCIVSINLIPHTVENTALGSLKAGSAVNLEIDTVARYVERMLSLQPTAPLKAPA